MKNENDEKCSLLKCTDKHFICGESSPRRTEPKKTPRHRIYFYQSIKLKNKVRPYDTSNRHCFWNRPSHVYASIRHTFLNELLFELMLSLLQAKLHGSFVVRIEVVLMSKSFTFTSRSQSISNKHYVRIKKSRTLSVTDSSPKLCRSKGLSFSFRFL
jgi:hypothetical protein